MFFHTFFKRLSCFLFYCGVTHRKKMLKDCKHFTKVLTCNCINNNLFKGKKHQSFTLMITLCVQSDLGPNCMPTPFSVEQNCFCNFGWTFLWNYLKFGPVVQEKVSFKVWLNSFLGSTGCYWLLSSAKYFCRLLIAYNRQHTSKLYTGMAVIMQICVWAAGVSNYTEQRFVL